MKHQCFEELLKKWDGPITRPVMFNRETGQMSAEKWAIQLYKTTKTGNISRNGRGQLLIDYCPLCGEKLIDSPPPPNGRPSPAQE